MLGKLILWIFFNIIMLGILVFLVADFSEDTTVMKKDLDEAKAEEKQLAEEIEIQKEKVQKAKEKESQSFQDMQREGAFIGRN